MLVVNHEKYHLEEHFIKWPVPAAPHPDYFNTNLALEMVLRNGGDLEDEGS